MEGEEFEPTPKRMIGPTVLIVALGLAALVMLGGADLGRSLRGTVETVQVERTERVQLTEAGRTDRLERFALALAAFKDNGGDGAVAGMILVAVAGFATGYAFGRTRRGDDAARRVGTLRAGSSSEPGE